MPKVSVIVPIYGVEQFIERCARSLLEQTLEDMQFVFVNDCTKDNSMEVLSRVIQDYPNRKNQIVIYDLPRNSGLCVVRKVGISLASGDYIAHCDSDDWVDPRMYESMYDKAVNEKLDIVQCLAYNSDGKEHHLFGEKIDNIGEKEVIMANVLKAKQAWHCIWNKLVKRDIYHNDIIYAKDYMIEDMVLSIQLIYYSQKIGVINQPFYYYFYNPNSICHKNDTKHYVGRSLSAKKNFDIILSFIESKGLAIRLNKDILFCKHVIKLLMVEGIKRYKDYEYWGLVYPDIDYLVIKSLYIPIKHRILFLLVRLKLYHIYSIINK